MAVIVVGRFMGSAPAPYITVNLSSANFVGGFLRMLIDTGASTSALQDADFRRLSIPYALLTPAPWAIVGVGGIVNNASILSGVDIDFSPTTGRIHRVHQDIVVFPPLAPGISLPSILGRDVINQTEFKCELRTSTVQFDF